MIATPLRRVLLAALVLVVTATACGSDEPPRELAGVRRTPLPDVTGVTLPDVSRDGAPFEFVADEGELLVLYFGYTMCPDVCPTTLADVRSALRQLDEDDAARVELAFATVDPDRDHADLITGYVQSFVARRRRRFVRPMTPSSPTSPNAFGVVYDVTTNDEGEIEVIHSGLHLCGRRHRDTSSSPGPSASPADDIAADLAPVVRRPREYLGGPPCTEHRTHPSLAALAAALASVGIGVAPVLVGVRQRRPGLRPARTAPASDVEADYLLLDPARFR